MKNRIVIIVVFCLLLNSALFAQGGWFFQNVNSTAHLHSIYFSSQTTGYISGWSSEVLKTTNGGINWFHLNCSLSIDIEGSYFVNNNLGWVVGGGGKIAFTSNGGLNWTSQNSGTAGILYSTFFLSSTTGWIVGDYGLILSTTNAGVNWNSVTSGTTRNLTHIFFVNSNTGWIAGDYGTVLKTTNGGGVWFSVNPGITNNIGKLFFVNSTTGWISGDYGIIIKTTNGGNNWILQQSGTSSWIMSPFFISANTGWIAGVNGIILGTTNGGDNWVFQTSNTTNEFRCNYFLDASTGFTVGFNGTVLKTTTGGVSYTISGYAKYNDNNQPVTIGTVKAIKLNKGNGNIIVVDSALVNADGSYMLSHVSQDTIDIGIYPNSTTQNDYVITHYPATTYWERATTLYPTGNISNINIGAIRMNPYVAANSVNGKVMSIMNSTVGNLKDAILYAKSGNYFVRCGVSDASGVYHLPSLPFGTIKIVANRLGYSSDSVNVNVTPIGNIDSINFYLRYLYVGIKKLESTVPSEYRLYQNYPNPFNPNTIIRFQLKESRNILLKLYDIGGKDIATLFSGKKSPGVYEITFDAGELPSGIYFYKMTAGNYIETKRMVLIK